MLHKKFPQFVLHLFNSVKSYLIKSTTVWFAILEADTDEKSTRKGHNQLFVGDCFFLFLSLFSRALFASLFEASKQILLRGWCIGARFFFLFFKKPIVCYLCCFYFLLCGSIPSEYVRFKCFGGLTRCCENVTATKTKMMCCTILVAKQKPGEKRYLRLFASKRCYIEFDARIVNQLIV